MRNSTSKRRPILFNGEMVRAILRGDKTQTRRPMRVQPGTEIIRMYAQETVDFGGKTNRWYMEYLNNGRKWTDGHKHTCPFGAQGDQLYVRETFRPVYINGETGMYSGTTDAYIQYKATPGGGEDRIIQMLNTAFPVEAPSGFGRLFFRAPTQMDHDWRGAKWKPSIHMPKWASRITLNVVDVRAERVQDITEDDAIAEGIVEDDNCIVAVENYGNGPVEIGGTRYFNGITDEGHESAGDSFADLWDSIYGNWDDDPWVWVCEFKVVENGR